MKIQLITSRTINKFQYAGITISEFGEPRSLDEYDVNVIDLGSEKLWKTAGQKNNTIDRIKDLVSLQSMVMHRNKSYIIYLFPQDVTFLSYDIHEGQYKRRTRLKDMLDEFQIIAKYAYPAYGDFPSVLYEKTKTTVGTKAYNADFYFEQSYNAVSISDMSNKPTTVTRNNYIYLTTLNVIDSEEYLIDYIKHILPKPDREIVPEWMNSVELFDDKIQKHNILLKKEVIEQAQESIKIAEDKLKENMYYKSILYTNGSELVEVVFSILEKILSCDMSEFVDERNEDFLIKKSTYTLIGEIKGVTSNVKREHVGQIEWHYQGYTDKLAEEGKEENVHQVLIINPFRTKPLEEREPVHDIQIDLAKRNGCLIIETAILLKLFEKFSRGEIDAITCEKLFIEKTGLLQESDF